MDNEHKLIPWCVDSLDEFLFYCCPECHEKSTTETAFLSHAVSEHPQSIAYLVKFNVEKYEILDKIVSYSLETKKEVSNQVEEKVEIVKHESENHVIEYNETDCIGSNELHQSSDESDTDGNVKDHFEFEMDENETNPLYEEIANDVTKSSVKEFSCDNCELSYKTAWSLKRHKLIHHTKKLIPKSEEEIAEDLSKIKWGDTNCNICGKIFKKGSWDVKRHYLRRHTKKLIDDEGKPILPNECDEQMADYGSTSGKETPGDQMLLDNNPYLVDEKIDEASIKSKVVLKEDGEVYVEYAEDLTEDASKSVDVKQNFNCDICGMDFSNASVLKTHKLRRHNKEPTFWMCTHCGKQFKCQKNMKDHVRKIHEKSEFKDDIQQKKECEYCKKSITATYYDSHVNTQHLGYKPFKCDQCDKVYGNKTILKRHILNAHQNNEEKFPCEQCGKLFASKEYLNNHLKNMHNRSPSEKKFKCNKCERAYRYKCDLQGHERVVHSNETQAFSCEKCGQQFSWKSGLRMHLQSVHEGVKEIECQFCKRKFYNKATRDNHEKGVHLKIKDMKCYVCSQMFSRYHHLQNHLDKIHNIKVSYKEIRKKVAAGKTSVSQ